MSARALRRPVLATALGVLAVTCGACSTSAEPGPGDPRRGGSVSVALAGAPDSLDPAVAVSPSALRALWLVHTPLLTYARDEGAQGTALVAGLASELPEVSADGRSLTLALRRGLRYSDGRRVGAEDFERAVKRALRLNPLGLELFGNVRGARRYARSLLAGADIVGISAETRTREVRIELRRPDPKFWHALAMPMAAPVPPGLAMRDLSGDPPPGVGPYRSVEPRPGTVFVLERSRGFELPGVPAGRVDEVAGEVTGDADTRFRAAIDSRVDVAGGEPPIDMIVRVRSELKDRYEEHLTLALDYLSLDAGRPPFSDEDMRRAVSFAIDEAALARLRGGFLAPTCNVLPPGVPGYRRLDPCPYGEREDNPDLIRARALVREAVSRPAPVTVASEGGPSPALEGYLVRTLRKLGFRARRATTPRERRSAQITFTRAQPRVPLPGRYLELADDSVLDRRVELLESEGPPRDFSEAWAALDREVVDAAAIAPYGVKTVGTLMSERMDAENCSRYHPVFGLDWSGLCLR